MAPWYRDLQKVEADGVITKREVDTKIAPWKDQMGEGNSYGKALRDLLGAPSTHPEVRLTAGAKKALEILTGKIDNLHHFSASVTDLSWGYGSGVHGPLNTNHGPSINMMITLPYIDVKPTYKVKIDEAKRTVTVMLQGTSENAVHPMVAVHPNDLSISVDRPKQFGKQYKLIVRDANPDAAHKNKILAQTTFGNFLPM